MESVLIWILGVQAASFVVLLGVLLWLAAREARRPAADEVNRLTAQYDAWAAETERLAASALIAARRYADSQRVTEKADMDLDQRLTEVEGMLGAHHRFIRKLVQGKLMAED